MCLFCLLSERPVELSLIFETRNKQAALLWTGISNRPLPKIEPNCFIDISLTLVPILPGLQTISGLSLVDLFLKRTYDYDDLAQVLVLSHIWNHEHLSCLYFAWIFLPALGRGILRADCVYIKNHSQVLMIRAGIYRCLHAETCMQKGLISCFPWPHT